MNSIKIHKIDRLSRILFYFILIAFFSYVFLKKDFIILICILILLINGVLVLYNTKLKREFYRAGTIFSNKLKLKTIVLIPAVIPGNNEKIYELHHKPSSLIEGFYKRRVSIDKIKNDLMEDLKKDFLKVSEWQKINNDTIVTTTHVSMKNMWEKCSGSFQWTKLNTIIDPYAKMSFFAWIISSFTTSGRFKISRYPREWNSYVLSRTKGIND